MANPSLIEEIFLTAVEKSPEEQRAYLDASCQQNSELRRQVERLLDAHPKAVDFLEVKAAAINGRTIEYQQPDSRAGVVIADRYKLLEQIGAGGMGEVWMADQLKPIKRRVAVKLIKAGMDSRNVLSRFEAERQALAVMDHPNIAKVLDAGSTEEGRPYFVMELVKGVPITTFCDTRKLSPKARLELFVPVCQAIQHAHQKGVIHRDIKPSNVLVELHDDKPVPKVIDFGLAKAVGQPLIENTLFTGFGSLVGTPTYMAPEQANFNAIDIDTRADVYALGILLYELLAGSPPLEPERFKKTALDEVLRMIREDDPPRPSQRLSSSEMKASIAAVRGSEPAKLAALIQGEIDWIVMKALEKDRVRRYDSAKALCTDVENFLSGDAVQAHPPSTNYLLRKFARKHRVALTTVLAFVVLLVAAVGVSSLLAVKASRSEAIAEEKRIEAEANEKKAQGHAEEADYYTKLFRETSEEQMIARYEAMLSATSLQIDLDLLELQSDRQAGMLRLIQRSKGMEMQIPSTVKWEMSRGQTLNFELPAKLFERQRKMQEFINVVVLSTGQEVAPLRPPITHDGHAVSKLEISHDYEKLMTLGTDDTVRLWDMRTGKSKAILRKASEKIVNAGFSPDGKVVFTDDSTGITRIWEVDSGSYQCEIPRRDGLFPTAVENKPYDFFADLVGAAERRMDRSACINIGHSRLLTQHVVAKTRAKDDPRGPGNDHEISGPIELWDTKTGMFIARLDKPGQRTERYRWFNDGKWLVTLEGLNKVSILSGQDGRLITQLEVPDNETIYSQSLQMSPDGLRFGLITMRVESPEWKHIRVRLWDSQTWKQRGMENGHFIDKVAFLYVDGKDVFRLWNDEVFSVSGGALLTEHAHYLFKFRNDTPIAEADGWAQPNLADTHLVMATDGRVFDTIDANQRVSEFGKRFNGLLLEFSKDKRFVATSSSVDFMFHSRKRNPFHLIDLKTDKWITIRNEFVRESSLGLLPNFGLANAKASYGVQIQLLPTLLKDAPLSPDLVEQWAQVAVRGQLNADGTFAKWDEPTWEKKRRELAAKPAPHRDFPFPGHVAKDTLHWLRQEFLSAKDAEKPLLAKQLLARADTADDKAEAIRWRTWLAANSKLAGARRVRPSRRQAA